MKTRNIVITSMMAALVCVATMIIKIPAPLNGYINAGDCVVMLAGWMLSPLYGFIAAGVGSALADILGGFPLYAPVTFLIKGLMAFLVYYVYKKISTYNKPLGRILPAVVAEVVMVVGYMMYEICLYGFVPSLANIPANLIQAAFGVISGLLLINFFAKNNIKF